MKKLYDIFVALSPYNGSPRVLKGCRNRKRPTASEKEKDIEDGRGKKDRESGELMSKCVITVLDLDN